MQKKLTLLLLVLLGMVQGRAEGLPTVSTEGKEVWYLIQFMNGGNAITAATADAEVTTSGGLGSDEQVWKVTGNDSDGYTFTNKKGLTLYAPSSAKNTKVSAAATPSGVTKFNIVPTDNANYKGAYEIQPKGNSSVSMNLWGGPSENRGVGFWDKNDQNNPVSFVEAKSFEQLGKISIVPYPRSLEVTAEDGLDCSALTAICYADEQTKAEAEAFAAQLLKSSGISLEVRAAATAQEKNTVWMAVDSELADEGYTLNVTADGVAIKAAKPAGFFYALQTLKQLLPRAYFESTLQKDAAWTLPFVAISDEPLLGHRGFMMDIVRHFFNKEEVKRTLDIMALYKMNRLHWHLTDDQGWRIEIPEYPLLTEVGSIRSGSFTSPGDGQKFFDDTEYGRGMWYSQEELKEIVAYAKARHIEILPEIDLPGHMVAAVTAYPELSCDPSKTYSVRIDGGISKDVLNIGDDKVVDFLKCVLDNVAKIFPYPYIHIGGDECPTDQWQNNADCLRRVKEEGLTGVNELQSWLVEELGTYLKEKHGKDIVVWDELLSHWNSSNKVQPVIMAWNSPSKASEAADKGFKSIYVPYQQLYLDFMQVAPDQATIDESYYGGWGDNWVSTLETVYGANPLSTLSGREDFCLGVQGNLWAETLNDYEELQYQLLPRMLALSEIGWLPAAQKSWASFYRRLQQQDEILDALGYTYAKHYIEQPELSEGEAALKEAQEILAAALPGQPGHPAADVYKQLEAIVSVAAGSLDSEAIVATLKEKLDAYKKAAIVQPQAGKYYQLVSASTYYKRQYEGSTVYQKDGIVRFHYTPQIEPEELWEFVPQGAGYVLRNVCTGRQMKLSAIEQGVELVASGGTVVRVDKATIASKNVTYVPGTVTISAVSGYNAAVTGSVKRLYAEQSGQVIVKDQAALCYPGTWTIVEVTDFTAQLQGLVKKCESVLRTARPGEMDQPSVEAVAFLKDQVMTPAQKALEGSVSEEVYNHYLALYAEFLAMPRTSVLDAISEDCYYRIRNAYFTDYYAQANTSTGKVEPKKLNEASAAQLWCFVKGDNGKVRIFNKATGKAAYITSSAEGITVMAKYAGSGLVDWNVELITTDQNATALAFTDPSGVYSWYTNPSSFTTILTKPKTWGASIWDLVKTDVLTSISAPLADNTATVYYDLNGRRVQQPTSGVYITSTGNKVLIEK